MRPRGVRCLRTLRREHGFERVAPAHGQIPPELEGRLYRVGPGRFEDSAGPYAHWFDGEGMITAIDFSKGEVSAASRLLKPKGFGSRAYDRRGRFGKAPERFWRRALSIFHPDMYVNPANTALIDWQGRLFALYEGGLPTEVDPDSLETIGATDLGVIRRAFSAHPKYHPASGAIINQGARLAPRPYLDYYALDAGGGARHITSSSFSGSVLTHDFAVTERFIVSICSPVFVDAKAILLGGKSASEALQWKPELGTEILLTSMDGAESKRFTTDAFFYSHTANAFDDGDDIVIHAAIAQDATGIDWIAAVNAGADGLPLPSAGRLTELRINSKSGAVKRKVLSNTAVDFPTVDGRAFGRPHRFVYGAGYRDEERIYCDLFDAVVKVDVKRGTVTKTDFGDGHYVSESVFVPDPRRVAEDAGWLLCVNYDANRDESYVAVLNAEDEPALVATVPVGQPLPMSFHGLWVDRASIGGRGPA